MERMDELEIRATFWRMVGACSMAMSLVFGIVAIGALIVMLIVHAG